MAVECGFDIFPRLDPETVDRENYCNFVTEIIYKYQNKQHRMQESQRNSDDAGDILQFPGQSPDSHKTNIVFTIGNRPGMPISSDLCEYFTRFCSTISAYQSDLIDRYIGEVMMMAWKHFGRDRVHFWKGRRAQEQGKYTWETVATAEKKLLDIGVDKKWIDNDVKSISEGTKQRLKAGRRSRPKPN